MISNPAAKCDEELAPGQTVAFGDRQRRRHHLRRDVRVRRTMDVAHRHRGDQVAVEQRRASERKPAAADDAALVGFRERLGQRLDLAGLIALVAGEAAGDGVDQDVLDVRAHARRNIGILQVRCKLRERLGEFRLIWFGQTTLHENNAVVPMKGNLLQRGLAGLVNGPPHALRRRRHLDMPDAECGQRVNDGVGDRRHRANAAGLARSLDAKRIGLR